jgi:3-hydroxyisobutyrate dehydrogenase
MQRKLEGSGLEIDPDIPMLVSHCDLVLSFVTARVAMDVAAQAATAWRSGVFVDFNSISPVQKKRAARLFRQQSYVDGAVLGSIAVEGTKAPLVLAGPQSEQADRSLKAMGLHTTVIGAEVGGASALKMCRSVFMKGVECLFVETLLAAAHFKVGKAVLESIERTFEVYGPKPLAEMLVTTHALHCARRGDEMKEVVRMLEETAVPSQMSQGARDFFESSCRSKPAEHFKGILPNKSEEVIEYLTHFYREHSKK